MGFWAQVLGYVLTAAGGWLVAHITIWIKAYLRKRQIEKEADNSVQPLKDAKTPEEIDESVHSALDDL